MSTIEQAAKPCDSRTLISRLAERVRVFRRNWPHRKTGRAFRQLEKALREDPDYRHTWLCNIAMPIFDESRTTRYTGPQITHEDSNALAERIMSHIFPK